MAMQMVLPHLSTALELALDWPNQSEDSFAEMFARALHCSKAAIWVPDPLPQRRTPDACGHFRAHR